MNKYLLLGDTHLGIKGSSDRWHNIVLDLFKEIRDVCVRRDIDTIIHLGDFFHERKAINTKTLDVAQEIENIMWDINMYIIVGNHDTFYKNQLNPTSLQIFKDSRFISVIDKIVQFRNIVMVPWGHEPRGIDGRGKYCFGHFAINGFRMNNSVVCKRGIQKEVITVGGYEHIYSGHFHTPSTQGNITYLGSPYPQTFHDTSSIHGYYIFDNGQLEFIEFKGAPKFVKITSEDVLGIKEFKAYGNVVKLIFTKDYGTVENEKIIDSVQIHKPFKFEVDFSQMETEDMEVEESISLLSNADILRDYIKKDKNKPENIKTNIALDIVDSMIEQMEV